MVSEAELQGLPIKLEKLIRRAEAFDARFKIGPGRFSFKIGYSQLIGAIPVYVWTRLILRFLTNKSVALET